MTRTELKRQIRAIIVETDKTGWTIDKTKALRLLDGITKLVESLRNKLNEPNINIAGLEAEIIGIQVLAKKVSTVI